jgi:elongation of very long chain fatty acids protein 6
MFYQWAYDLGYYYTNTFTNAEDWLACVLWFERHWWFFTLSAVLYLPCVYIGKNYMEHRPPYNVNIHLKVWNFLMCIFSLAGTIYTIPVCVFSWYSYGWQSFICGADEWPYEVGIAGEFIVVFIVSKALEFVDTLLLIVRKKPIIFLHYYHHVITFLFTWYQGVFEFHINGMGYFFSAMNFLVGFVCCMRLRSCVCSSELSGACYIRWPCG